MPRAKNKSTFINPAAIRERLLIDTTDGPRLLVDVADSWQLADFDAMDPAWRRSMGQRDAPARMLGYWERPRGHDKTGSAAVATLAALVGAPRQIAGCWVAASKEQAQLGRHAIDRLVSINDLLSSVIDVQEFKIVNKSTGSWLDILASDSNTTFGRTDDFCIVDELTNWPDRGEAVWQTIWSTIPKRGALLLIIANAGVGAGVSWQWRIREAARTGARWYFSTLDGPQASWITPDDLEEQRRMLPDLAYRRLWKNQWTTGCSDVLTTEDIAAAFAAGLPMLDRNDGTWAACGAIDGAVSRDWAAWTVTGRNAAGRYRVMTCQIWKPPRGGKIDQERIEERIAADWKALKLSYVAADPFQLEYLISRLQKRGVRIEARQQSGKNLVEQALAVVSQFSSRNVDCPPFAPLEYDLQHSRLEERSYGLRLVSDHGPQGHGDLLSSLSIGMAAAKELPPAGRHIWGGVIANEGFTVPTWAGANY